MTGFSIYRFKSLNTRLTIFLLIPVFLLLMTGGALTFVFTRNLLLEQWRESTVLKLSRAAHSIEMRLTAPLNIMEALFTNESAYRGTGEDIAALLKGFNGVMDVDFAPGPSVIRQGGGDSAERSETGKGFRRCRIKKISNPRFDTSLEGKVVTIAIEILDRQDRAAGTLKIQMGFDFLMAEVAGQEWWKSYKACLVTRDGTYLADADNSTPGRAMMGASGDTFEKKIMARIARERSGTVTSGEFPPKGVAGFYTLEPVPWVLILFGEGETVLAPLILYRNSFFGISMAMVLVIVLLIRKHTRRVVGEIQTLSQKAADVANGRYGSPIPVAGRDEISRLVQNYNKMVDGLKQRDFIRDSFGRYVDPEFARQLMERPEKSRLGGQRRQVVILMSDLRGFTPMAESLDPEITIDVLNRYLSRMIQIIQSHQGIIVDFFGDAILVFFDPLDTPVNRTVQKALACACAMQESMNVVNRDLSSKGLPQLAMGIGMHTGPVVVGNIGSDTRAKYGIVGSAVNITSRIQARAGQGEILVSEDLLELLPDVGISHSFTAQLKGIQTPMTLTGVVPETLDS